MRECAAFSVFAKQCVYDISLPFYIIFYYIFFLFAGVFRVHNVSKCVDNHFLLSWLVGAFGVWPFYVYVGKNEWTSTYYNIVTRKSFGGFASLHFGCVVTYSVYVVFCLSSFSSAYVWGIYVFCVHTFRLTATFLYHHCYYIAAVVVAVVGVCCWRLWSNLWGHIHSVVSQLITAHQLTLNGSCNILLIGIGQLY